MADSLKLNNYLEKGVDSESGIYSFIRGQEHNLNQI